MSQLLHSKYTVLWMDWFRGSLDFHADGVAHCCGDMTKALTNVCEEHQENPFECSDMLISFSPMFREYGLIIHDGMQSMVIAFCPWCGIKLPSSLRHEWFDTLEAAGFPEPFDEENPIPEKFKSAAWWLRKD